MTGVGNCVDMTILICALARALGLDARATVVSLDGENYIHMLAEGAGIVADPVECDRLLAAGAAMNALPATLRAVAAAKTAFPPAAIIDPLIAMARAPEPIIATYAGPASSPDYAGGTPAMSRQGEPAYSPPPAFTPPPGQNFDPGIRPEFQPPPDYGVAPAPPSKCDCECPPRWPWLAAGLGLGWLITRVNK